MKKTLAFFFALTVVSVSYAFAQEIDTLAVVATPDTLIVADAPLAAPEVVVTEPEEPAAAPEEVLAEEPEVLVAPDPVPEAPAVELYTEAPKKDKQIFNHLAVAPTIGFDGYGVEVATTFTPYLQLRAGFSYSPTVKATVSQMHGIYSQIPTQFEYNDQTLDLSNASVALDINSWGPNFMLDVYPGKKTPFHFTFGFVYNPGMYIQLKADISDALNQLGVEPGEYNTFYIGLDENDDYFRISPSRDGVITAGVDVYSFRPYMGIGFGRQINPNKRVCVSFDMGALYIGTPYAASYDYSVNPDGNKIYLTSEKAASIDNLKGAANVLDIIERYATFLPVMKLNVFIRIF